MCLTLPAKVKKISKMMAELEGGRLVKCALIPKLKPGDWVLANADLAVAKISPKEAKEINNYFPPGADQPLAEKLKKTK